MRSPSIAVVIVLSSIDDELDDAVFDDAEFDDDAVFDDDAEFDDDELDDAEFDDDDSDGDGHQEDRGEFRNWCTPCGDVHVVAHVESEIWNSRLVYMMLNVLCGD